MTELTKDIEGERHLSMTALWEGFGKPQGFKPSTWVNSEAFWMMIGTEALDRDQVIVSEGKELWIAKEYGLDYAATMHAKGHADRATPAFLEWLGNACDESEATKVAARVRIHGETPEQARAILRRYC